MKLSKEHRYIFGNWKMSQSLAAGRDFFRKIDLKFKENKKADQIELGIFPSYPHILELVNLSRELPVTLGAQDCSNENEGAFTGEVSCSMLSELGATAVLIGHSERRKRFKESNELLAKKLDRALEAELLPVFCFGETKEERESGQLERVLKAQLEVVKTFEPSILLAYEPVWAIGTGLTASPQQIEETHSLIASWMPKSPILYGGSVKPANCAEILGVSEVHGLLIGGASLDPDGFSQISRLALESLAA